jgi:hypothetical protein
MTPLHLNRCRNQKYEIWNFTIMKYVRFSLVVQINLKISKLVLIVFYFNLPQSPYWLWDLRFSQRCCCGFRSSWMWHCVVGWVVAYVLGERSALIFKGQVVQEWNAWPLMRKSLCSFEMLGTTQAATKHYILEDLNPLYLLTAFIWCVENTTWT